MILVTGATGNIGGEVVRLLLAAGQRVRVLTRTPQKAAALGPVEVAQGDFADPASIARAMAGVRRALLIVPGAELLPAVGPHFFAAAQKAALEHVVFVSSGTIAIEPQVTIGRWHLEAEEQLKATGVPWTMLRPVGFASNALRWAGSIRAKGAVFSPNAHGKTAPIDPRDIAAVAAKVFTTPGHAGQTYVLTGPALISPAEQLEQLGARLGRPLRFHEVPEAQARAGMVQGGLSDAIVDPVLELIRAGREGRSGFLTSTVRELTGRDARSFDAWAQDHLGAFQGQ